MTAGGLLSGRPEARAGGELPTKGPVLSGRVSGRGWRPVAEGSTSDPALAAWVLGEGLQCPAL